MGYTKYDTLWGYLIRTEKEWTPEVPKIAPTTVKTIGWFRNLILDTITDKETKEKVNLLYPLFQEMGCKDSPLEIAKKIKKHNYYSYIIQVEEKCPWFLLKLKKKFKLSNTNTLLDCFWSPIVLDMKLESAIRWKYENKEDTRISFRPICDYILEKENPTDQDQENAIRAINDIVDKETLTMEEAILKDRNRLLDINSKGWKIWDYETCLRGHSMGTGDINTTKEYLFNNLESVLEEARIQGKPKEEIETIRQLVERWKKQK